MWKSFTLSQIFRFILATSLLFKYNNYCEESKEWTVAQTDK